MWKLERKDHFGALVNITRGEKNGVAISQSRPRSDENIRIRYQNFVRNAHPPEIPLEIAKARVNDR
jgi:hypothetical protein